MNKKKETRAMNLNQVKRMVREEARRAMGREVMESPVDNDALDAMCREHMADLRQDFSDVEKFGDGKIMAAYRRACARSKDHEFWIGLCIALARKHQDWRRMRNRERAELYYELWKEADNVTDTWPEEEREYYRDAIKYL